MKLRRAIDGGSAALTPTLVVVIALATAWVARAGLDNQELQADEFAFGLAGVQRFAVDFFGTLFSASPVNRGPERFMALALWVPDRLFADTADMFRAAHLMTALFTALAAVPAYAIARLLELRRRHALLVAALTIITPWLIYGATLLNVTAAFPLTTALVWSVMLAVTRPSIRHDLLVVVIGALGATARTGNLPFVAIAAIAVFVQVWRDRPRGETVSQALRRYPRRLLGTHPLLVGVGVLTIAAVLAIGVRDIIGGQYQGALPKNVTLGYIVTRAGQWGAMLALGCGVIPAIIGLPWALRQAARPTERAAGAFAVTALALFVVYVVTTLQAPLEERYVAVLAGLAPPAFGAALFRREAMPIGTLLAGLVVLRIVFVNRGPHDDGAYSWMVKPTRQFFFHGIEGRVESMGGPGEAAVAVVLAAAVAVAVGVALACSARLALPARRVALVAGMTGTALLGVGALQANYNVDRWLAGLGRPTWTWEDRTFVDRTVGPEGHAMGWDYNPGRGPVVPYAMAQAQAFNRRFGGAIRLNTTGGSWACCRPDVVFSVDARTGHIESATPLPRYIIEPPGFKRIGFAAALEVSSPSLADYPLRDLGGRPRISYTVTGAGEDGIVQRRATLRAFAARDSGRATCARLVLTAASEVPARGRVTATEAKPVSVDVPSGRVHEALIPLTGRRPVVTIEARRGPIRLADIALDCTA
jgi:hypothetical protein